MSIHWLTREQMETIYPPKPDWPDIRAHCFGVDLARPGGDHTAIAISQIIEEGQRRLAAVVAPLEAAQADVLSVLVKRMERKLRLDARPKGYSRSHWRKIVKANHWPEFRIVADWRATGAQLSASG